MRWCVGVARAKSSSPPRTPPQCILKGVRGQDCGLGFQDFCLGGLNLSPSSKTTVHCFFLAFAVKASAALTVVTTWCRVSGFRLRIEGLGLRVSGYGFRGSDFGFRVSGFGFWVSGFGFRVSGCGFRVSDFGFRTSCFGFRVSGCGFWVSDYGLCVAGLELMVAGCGFGDYGLGCRV